MKPQQIVALLLLLYAVTVLGLQECLDQGGLACVALSDTQCGPAYPRVSPTALLCPKSCGLCKEGPTPTCSEGYFDSGLDTCMPCSTRCHGAANCTHQLTCPQGCPPGRHGLGCERRCPPGCLATCDRWSGLCTEGCRRGRHGDWCHKSCPPLCKSSWCSQATGQCRKSGGQPAARHRREVTCPRDCRNGLCNSDTGECTDGCQDGKHGEKCNEWCPRGCNSRRCNQTSGHCLDGCIDGWHGGKCDQWCSVKCKYPRRCNQTSGRCLDGCNNSYNWGDDCTLQCPSGCLNNYCNRTTGACLRGCDNGYNNAFCAKECQSGQWGEDCDKSCPPSCQTCHQLSGQCQQGCQEGWWGTDCTWRCPDTCDEGDCDQQTGHCGQCQDGHWGHNCSLQCPSGCLDQTCDQDSGQCDECQTGLWGEHCNKTCPPGCRDNSCDQGTGHCEACPDGVCGSHCNVSCQECHTCNATSNQTEQCPKHCKKKACDPSTRKCSEGCKGGYWSENCSKKCAEGCMGGKRPCDQSTGKCKKGCKAEFYGELCHLNCSSNCKGEKCNDTKNGVECTRGCKKGYKGRYCEEVDGEVSCPNNCFEGKCDEKTSKCSHGCLQRFYGDKCEDKCGNSCVECDRHTGDCTLCDPGYYGALCLKCSDTCRQELCLHNGSCTEGCKDGHWGDTCNETCTDKCKQCDRYQGSCTKCQEGHYGTTCEKCPENCKEAKCHQNGSCTSDCRDGHWGSTCNMTCTDRCEQCDSDNGDCTNCESGYHGVSCQKCSEGCAGEICHHNGACSTDCKDGYWGTKCKKTCSATHCLQCERQGGDCTKCQPGFYGASCQNCSANCKQDACHHNGSCSEGCVDGFSGDRCNKSCAENCTRCHRYSEKCETCEPGFYNYNNGGRCYACPKNCKGGTCHAVRGDCDDGCVTGHWGPECYWSCPDNCQDSLCNSTSGFCTAGCHAGFRGQTCRDRCPTECRVCSQYGDGCSACLPGSYSAGDNCTSCPPSCNGTCDAITGHCPRCLPGHFGPQCRKSCSSSCRSVEEGALPRCQMQDGVCQDGCRDGLHGDHCDRKCSQQCHADPPDVVVCNRTNGACPHGCLAGWRGDNCSQPCQKGTYGRGCSKTCGQCLAGNHTCVAEDGDCKGQCQEGYAGKNCHEEAAVQGVMSVEAKAGIGGGIIVLVLVLLGAGLIYFLVIRPRRQRKSGGGRQNYELVAGNPPRNGVAGPSSGNAHTKKNGHTAEEAEDGVAGDDVYTNAGVAQLAEVRVAVPDLRHYVIKAVTSGKLARDFETLPRGLIASHSVADKPQNKSKNRYKNICAYDRSRVVLKPEPTDPESTDYINACYIAGHKNPKKYIAVQGPMPPMVNDFWQMLWQHDVGRVVMLTNLVEEGKVKCMQYWPDPGAAAVCYGAISVRCSEEVVLADFTVRTMEMKLGSSSPKTVTQFHFTSWPDRGVPHDLTTLLEFNNKVRWSHCSAAGPLVVHCSAGIGRTGTYIALDRLLEEAKEEGSVNIYTCVISMRHQRVNMVQTEDQYIYLHEVLSLSLLSADTTVSAADFPEYYNRLQDPDSSGSVGLAAQFQLLQNLTEQPNPADFVSAMAPENATKNRRPDILPSDSYRPYLTSSGGKGDYINAVSLPTYLLRKGLILTQAPLPNTVEDLYRLVTNHSCRAVLVLNDASQQAEDKYWPDVGSSRDYDTCSVTTVEKAEETFADVFSLEVKEKERERKRKVRLYEFGGWPPAMDLPPSPYPLVELLEETEDRKSTDPVIVHCLDGNERSGLLCVLQAVLERVKMEQEVAIFQTVYQLRLYRHQLIPTLEQYRYLHECVQAYIDTNCAYTNFSSIHTHQVEVKSSSNPSTPLLSNTHSPSC